MFQQNEEEAERKNKTVGTELKPSLDSSSSTSLIFSASAGSWSNAAACGANASSEEVKGDSEILGRLKALAFQNNANAQFNLT